MRSASLFAVAVMVVLAASAVMPASAHINLLQNPGFETGSLAPGWDIHGDWYDWDVSDAGAHTGTYYAWIEVEEDEAWFEQDIEPPRCAQYLDFWYRGDWWEGGVLEVGVDYSDGSAYFEELPWTDEERWTFRHIDLDTAKLVEAVEAYVGAWEGYIDVDDFDLEACATVGGVVMPANTLVLISPWLAVIGLVGCIGTAVVVGKHR